MNILMETMRSQMPSNTFLQLQGIDRFWQSYRTADQSPPGVVWQSQASLCGTEFDVAICGGTLGIIIGCALQMRGWQVVIIEKGILRGRAQEWNISRKELDVFLELGLLTVEELEAAIATEYNPGRVAFCGGIELWVKDVLNIGIDPVLLLEILKLKFLSAGGQVLEETGFKHVVVHPDGVSVEIEQQKTHLLTSKIKARLLLDVMGHFSAIAQQARLENGQNLKPDGVCMVVGSCAQGIPKQESGDLIVTFTPIQNQCQYFWEAFPARDGRTTYMFTYVDAHRERPSFAQLFADYLFWLPQYQDVDLAAIHMQRTLFGFFPSYKQTPLQTAWDRILQVGDSSGSQSPLSFGGFGSMVRHLTRLTEGINAALTHNLLSRQDLRLLHAYQPNLSVTWLFQKAMSVGIDQKIPRDRINSMLSTVFQSMQELGEPVLKPFLQDIVQFPALSQTMLKMAVADPLLVAQIVQQVGLPVLLDWMRHYINLGEYSLFSQLGETMQPTFKNLLPEQRYYWQCWLENWQYGSGSDY